jgi:hypothetical protein
MIKTAARVEISQREMISSRAHSSGETLGTTFNAFRHIVKSSFMMSTPNWTELVRLYQRKLGNTSKCPDISYH